MKSVYNSKTLDIYAFQVYNECIKNKGVPFLSGVRNAFFVFTQDQKI